MRINYEHKSLLPGVSGIMRVKNDGLFIEDCVESCVSALDELIIVWNDCNDNSLQEIEKMKLRYPNKIRTFEYKYKVYSTRLSKEEYVYAKSLPENSPHLLCNYYNFALSKVKYQYAMKIDADQMYFTEKLCQWNSVYRENNNHETGLLYTVGFFVKKWDDIVTKLNSRLKRILPFHPQNYPHFILHSYNTFVKRKIYIEQAAVSLSGINVLKYDGKIFVPLGGRKKSINILPPFNGEGDHLIFRVSKDCYYETYDSLTYSQYSGGGYSLIEKFHHPYKVYKIGFFGHLNMMRLGIFEKITEESNIVPSSFICLGKLKGLSYNNLIKMTDDYMFSFSKKNYFQFVYSLK